MPKKNKRLFNINENIIETLFLDGIKHHFVFFNKKYDIPKYSPKKYSFTVKLLTSCKWLAIGICDKKIVEKILDPEIPFDDFGEYDMEGITPYTFMD